MKNKELPKGSTIRKHNKSEVIQIFFMYRNVRCREIIPVVRIIKHLNGNYYNLNSDYYHLNTRFSSPATAPEW